MSVVSGAVVLLEIGGVRLGVRASEVLEVLAVRDATPVPAAPAWLRGLVTHRGVVVALIDAGQLLGGPPTPDASSASALLIGSSLGPLAIAIDRVIDVARSAPEDCQLIEVEPLVRQCRATIEAENGEGS